MYDCPQCESAHKGRRNAEARAYRRRDERDALQGLYDELTRVNNDLVEQLRQALSPADGTVQLINNEAFPSRQ